MPRQYPTIDDEEAQLLHNHDTAVVGGPPSRNRHHTSLEDAGFGGKMAAIGAGAVVLAFNGFLIWAVGQWIGLWK
ncbi:hypothetical protein G7Y79_00019g046550 [Physcia stellaris]|nr:hypothetical protein G7Y79_00019g046550 [Physcia stellaris]